MLDADDYALDTRSQPHPDEALDGRYLLGRVLGSGGVAQVRQARDLLLERDVAVKLFGPGIDPRAPDQERAEMRILAGLTHPNLVTVHDAGTDSSTLPPRAFLVMALIDGPSLADSLRGGRLAAERVHWLAIDIASALAYVHSRGVVHRDVKPANILLNATGRAFLADFGIAQTIGAGAVTSDGCTIGTAAFMSPEQVRGQEVGPAADVYAFGLVLLEALTGQREYPGTTVETALARLSRFPQVTGRVPEIWRDLLTAMTATDPQERPGAAEVRYVLEQEMAPSSSDAADVIQLLPPPHSHPDSPDADLYLDRVPEPEAQDGTRVMPLVTRDAAPPRAESPARAVPLRREQNDLPAPRTGAAPASAYLRWIRRDPQFGSLAGTALAAVVLLIAVVGWAASAGTSRRTPTAPPPPAGTPGPQRLTHDLDRLHELVQP